MVYFYKIVITFLMFLSLAQKTATHYKKYQG